MNEKKSTNRTSRLTLFVKWFLLLTTIGVVLAFGIAEPKFFKTANLFDIIRSSVTLSTMAIGLVFVFAAGEIDFAAGSEMSAGAVIIGRLMDTELFHDHYVLAFILTLCFLALIGLCNGLLVVKVHMPAFIATLGMSTMLTGILKYLTNGGYFIGINWPDTFTLIGQKYTFGVIPNPVWVLIACAIVSFIILQKTRIGRYFYAVGANVDASAHVGINVARTKIYAFMLCTVFIGIAGIVSASTIRSCSATIGADSLLGALSALMLGATFLTPGIYNVLGAVLGGLLLAIISNGLIMVNATYFMKDIVQASILLIAVGFISMINRGLKVKGF